MFYTEPWKHHILDNFFDNDTLKYCHNLIKSSSLKQNNHTVLKDKRLLTYFIFKNNSNVQKDSFEPPGQKKHHSASDFRPPMRLSDKKEKIEMPAQSHQFWRDKHVFAELDELRG